MEREIVKTSDGSHSLYIPEMDEQYHSKHGAIAEAKKVFIEYGLEFLSNSKKQLKILEVGFGTGLNALLTMEYVLNNYLEVNYDALEKYPLNKEEISTLNYVKLLGAEQEYFSFIHECDWNKESTFKGFSIRKVNDDLKSILLENSYDLIYFDAFAPEKQANMWSHEIFEKLFKALHIQGVLTTYCVKGEIRRRLQNIGFEVEKLKGPEGGKREVLRAIKR